MCTRMLCVSLFRSVAGWLSNGFGFLAVFPLFQVSVCVVLSLAVCGL